MATYQNNVNDPSALVALGSPSLAAGDQLEFIQFSTIYTSADFSATDLLKVTLGKGFGGTFETANGGGLKLTCNRTSTGAVWNRSRARRIDLSSTSSAGVIYKVHQAGTGQLWISSCKINTLFASAGTTFIAGDVDITTINLDVNAQLFYRKTTGGFAATTINVRNGAMTIENDFGTLNVYGGEARLNDASVTPTAINGFGGTITVINSGTIGGMTLENCVIDWSQMLQAVTVSGTTSIGPGVTIRYSRSGLQPTWTTSNTSTDPKIEYVD